MSETRDTMNFGHRVIEIGSPRVSALIVPSFGGACVGLSCNGQELLYGANELDAGPMGGRIPVLFPAVGRSFEGGQLGSYCHNGITYPMQIHGFAKDMAWQLADRNDASVSCSLRWNDETLRHYPYRFELRVVYSISGQAFKMVASVENLGEEPMPFCFGFHPYFKAPLTSGSREDCVVKIPGTKIYSMFEGQPTGKLPPAPSVFQTGLRLSRGHLESILGKIPKPERSSFARCELCHTVSNERIIVEFEPEQLETVTVYSPEGAGFVCIEPRTGLPNALSDTAKHRAGMKTLRAGAKFKTTVRIRLETGTSS